MKSRFFHCLTLHQLYRYRILIAGLPHVGMSHEVVNAYQESLAAHAHHIPLLAAQFTIQSTRICELATMMNSARKEDTFVSKGIRLRELSLYSKP
jgi:hypothetical protein